MDLVILWSAAAVACVEHIPLRQDIHDSDQAFVGFVMSVERSPRAASVFRPAFAHDAVADLVVEQPIVGVRPLQRVQVHVSSGLWIEPRRRALIVATGGRVGMCGTSGTLKTGPLTWVERDLGERLPGRFGWPVHPEPSAWRWTYLAW